ncbi:MAG: hypothetical protein ACJATW_002449 [Glaciecola sp.]
MKLNRPREQNHGKLSKKVADLVNQLKRKKEKGKRKKTKFYWNQQTSIAPEKEKGRVYLRNKHAP